jgi:hypothetical protein
MVVPVNDIHPPHPNLPKTNWKMLGQLKLRAGSNSSGTIKEWLTNTLGDFRLPDNLMGRLLVSIEEAAEHFLSLDSIEGQPKYLEIAVLAPGTSAPEGHTWGFFRLEKTSIDPPTESSKGHCIEYYLYLDMKTEK